MFALPTPLVSTNLTHHKHNPTNVKQTPHFTVDRCGKFAHVRNVPNQIVLELVVNHIARMLVRIVERQIVMGVTVITHKKTVRLDGSVI
jgi:hypothetical protein